MDPSPPMATIDGQVLLQIGPLVLLRCARRAPDPPAHTAPPPPTSHHEEPAPPSGFPSPTGWHPPR